MNKLFLTLLAIKPMQRIPKPMKALILPEQKLKYLRFLFIVSITEKSRNNGLSQMTQV
jgi:hypothetical protein